jgi:hypothetical protein
MDKLDELEVAYLFLRRKGLSPEAIEQVTYPQYWLERLADLPPNEVDVTIDETGESLRGLFG